jgi:hypothetical protein
MPGMSAVHDLSSGGQLLAGETVDVYLARKIGQTVVTTAVLDSTGEATITGLAFDGEYAVVGRTSARTIRFRTPPDPRDDDGKYAPEMFGAAGDGETDDTRAIERAVAAADGGVLRLSPGATYLYSSVVYTVSAGIVIEGNGATLESSLALVTNTAEFWIKGSDVTIRDVAFTQSVSLDVATQADDRAGNAHTLRVGGVSSGDPAYRVTVENVRVLQSRNTPILAQYVDTLRIAGCNLKNGLGNGIFVGDSFTDIRIEGNSVYNMGDDGIGVYQNTGLAGYIEQVVVEGNTVELTDAKGIGFGGVKGGVISGNTIRNTYTAGIYLIEDVVFDLKGNSRIQITGNVVEEGGKCYGSRLHATASSVAYGIHASGANSEFSISDNLVWSTETRGISVDAGDNVAISGNTVITAGGVGIQVGDPDGSVFTTVEHVRVSGNTTRGTIGGIIVGSATNVSVTGNNVSSYKSGASGTRRGITFGKVSNGSITGNVVYNDDSGNETVFTYNSPEQVRHFGNFEQAAGDGEAGNVLTIGTRRIGFGSAAPTTGTWQQGDVIFDTGAGSTILPASSGWQCRAAGTPGTWKQFGHFGIVPFAASTTWDPGSIADGAIASTTVTVTGVGTGDACEVAVGHSAGIPAGAILAGSVTSANTVTVTLFNKTGGALDLASGTLRVTCWKHQ